MPFRLLSLALFCLPALLHAQSETPARYEIYGGYTYLSNTFNAVQGGRQPLNGWDASVAFASWHNLRFKLDTSAYRGTNLGAPQDGIFILAGGEYSRRIRRESVFVEGLAGDLGLNKNWGPQGTLGQAAAFATLAGGGLDTPIARHFAYRVDGGFIYAYTALQGPPPLIAGFRVPGQPTYFGRLSTGVVWKF